MTQSLDLGSETGSDDRRTRALLRIVEAQRVVHGARDRDDVIRIVADHALQVFPHADSAVVELVEGDRLRYAAATGALVAHLGLTVAVQGSLSGLSLRERSPLRCDDAETDPRVDAEACRRTGIRSMMLVPLFAGDVPFGVLKVASGRPGTFDEEDTVGLEVLGESLRAGVQHADTYARSQRLLAERTEALVAREASEELFRLAFDSSPMGICLVGVVEQGFGTLRQVNSAFAAIVGYTVEELEGRSFADLKMPGEDDDPGRVGRLVAESKDGTWTAETRYRHADGHPVRVRVRGAVARDASGAARYMVAQVEDVTEQYAAQARLERAARMIDLIPAAVIVREADGRIRWWNATAAELYGWPVEIATGKNTHRLLSTRFPEGVTLAGMERALATQGFWSGPLLHLTADGRTVRVLSRMVAQVDEHGAATILEINADITSSWAAERALAESEQRFRAQFTHSAAGQAVRALDGELLDVNPAFAAMLGYEPDDLVGASWHDIVHPDDDALARHQLADLMSGGREAVVMEARLRRRDGSWAEVSKTSSLIRDADGLPATVITVVQDISDRLAAERARDAAATELATRNAELQAANAFKADMIGMLGHEIGTPLTAISGFADLARTALDRDPTGSGARDALAIVGRHALALGEVVREIMTMVTADAGRLSARPQRLPLRPQLVSAIELQPHRPRVECAEDLVVLVQPGHLAQVLANLLSNATKYAGGATRVVATRTAVGTVEVAVEDAGPGIPDHVREHLFERFSRGDVHGVPGTGLGLYVVRELARANGGEIEHRPLVGGGSSFVLTLVEAGPEAEPDDGPEAGPVAGEASPGQ